MKYLGIQPRRPKVAVFDLTGCEGCELQLANKEDTLVPFLQALDIVRFREVSSAEGDDYEVALIDGAVTRDDEVARLERIRAQASLVVSLGSCACFGGVAKLKNAFDLDEANRIVYGDSPKDTAPARAVGEVISVDLEIPGCPVTKLEVERVVRHLVLGVPYTPPAFPVCLECKQRFTVCAFERGQLCLGPITRGGCGAPCPAAGLGCWGCRGAAADCNCVGFVKAAQDCGFAAEEIDERLSLFGGFATR